MSSKDRSKTTSTPPSSLPSSPSMGKGGKKSPNVNRKSVKLDVPKSFTIDVNQIAVARKQLKNVGKGGGGSGEVSSITLSAPEKQGSLHIMEPSPLVTLSALASSASPPPTWTQFWCVLKDGSLYIFPNSKAPVPDKVLSLQGCKVNEKRLMMTSAGAGSTAIDHCFQIITQGQETIFLRTDEDFEYITWIVALRGATLYLKIITPRGGGPSSSSGTPTTTIGGAVFLANAPHAPTNANDVSRLDATTTHGSLYPQQQLQAATSPVSSLSPASPAPAKRSAEVPLSTATFPVSPTSSASSTSTASSTLSNLPGSSSPAPSRRGAPVQKNTPTSAPTIAVSPSSPEVKIAQRNSIDVSKLPSRATEMSPPPLPLSLPLSPLESRFAPSYRKSADVSKLSKSMDLSPLSGVISAAYRKSADLSKLSSSQTLAHSSPSSSSSSPSASASAAPVSSSSSISSLFASTELISSPTSTENNHESLDGVKTKRGPLAVPGGIFTKWKQRWVVLANDTLSVYKHEDDEDKQDKEPVHSFEIVFCQPKVCPSEKGKFVFEIHAPGRTVQFGAPSSVDLLDWITTIQETQTTLMQSYLQYNLNGSSSNGAGGDSRSKDDLDTENKQQHLEAELEKSRKRLADIMKLPGNNLCADCGASDPLWASVNVGVFICIECSGVHRQMGSHISKVRSVTMDKWDSDQLEFMESNGNLKVNAELECNIPPPSAAPSPPLPSPSPVLPQHSKLTPASSRQWRDAFIKAKYDEKKFVSTKEIKKKKKKEEEEEEEEEDDQQQQQQQQQ